MPRKFKSFVAVLTAFVFALSLVVTPPRAQADGGKGSDTLLLIAPTLAPLAFIALSLGTSPLAKRFQAVTTALTVMILLSGPAMMPLYLQALARFTRQNPVLGNALQFGMMYVIVTAATFQHLAQARGGRSPGYIGLHNFLAWPALPSLPAEVRLSDVATDARARFDSPSALGNLRSDAAAGDPTARMVQRLLPLLSSSIDRGRGWVDYGIGPAHPIIGLFALPSYFLKPAELIYDRKFWDRAMSEALDAMECDDCLWDLEEDADWGDPSAIAALMIFDTLVGRRNPGATMGLRINRRIVLNPVIELQPENVIGKYGADLRTLRSRITLALDETTEVEPLWSKMLRVPKGTFADMPLMTPDYDTYTGFRSGGIDWPDLAADKGATNQADDPPIRFNLRLGF